MIAQTIVYNLLWNSITFLSKKQWGGQNTRLWQVYFIWGCCMWSLSPPPGPSLLLVLSDSLELACNGLTDKLHRGSVVFLPSEREAKFYPKVEEKETLLFQAYCSLWWQYVQQIGLSRYFLFNSFLFCIFENYWSSFDWFNCMFVCVIYTLSIHIRYTTYTRSICGSPSRTQTLFCCVFQPHYRVWSSVTQNFC